MSSSLTHVGRGSAPQVKESRSPAHKSSLVIWALILAGTILRLIALGHKSFWLDEIASVTIARRPWPTLLHFLWHDEGNMALYYVLLKPWLHFGHGEAAVRLLSVIAGVVSIPLMYRLGSRLLGGTAATLIATLLAALSTCAIAVSQEARAYSFLVLFGLLSTYLFVRLIERPGYSLALGYALISGLTCYFHYFGVLLPAAHAISIFALPARRRPWKPLLLAWSIIALLASPILWLMHAQDVGHISWLQTPSWLELYHLGVFLAADGGKAVGAVLLAIELVLAGLFLAKLPTVWREHSDGLLRWHYALIASLVFAPVVITLLVSIVRPAFYHRFLIICLPGWLLMIAIGAEQLRVRAWRVAALVVVCTLSLVTTVLWYRRATEDWRGAVNYLIANTGPEDRVVYYQSVGEFAGESYREWLQPPNILTPAAIGINLTNPGWHTEIADARRVWLVLYRVKPDDAGASAIERQLDEQYALHGLSFFQGVMVLEYDAR